MSTAIRAGEQSVYIFETRNDRQRLAGIRALLLDLKNKIFCREKSSRFGFVNRRKYRRSAATRSRGHPHHSEEFLWKIAVNFQADRSRAIGLQGKFILHLKAAAN